MLQLPHVALVCKAHERLEVGEEFLVLAVSRQFAYSREPVAVGKSCQSHCVILSYSISAYESVPDAFSVYLLYVDSLHTASYGLKEPIGILTHHDEDGLRGRFLYQFEY